MKFLANLYNGFFGAIERGTQSWLPGLAARFVFASTLFLYFWNSALTKLGEGTTGFLNPSTGAYAQILPSVMENVGYDVSQIAFFPFGLIVLLGTWGEIVLPIAIIIGLLTRAAALGMIIFVVVMSYVDINFHGLEEKSIGAMFDRFPGAIIYDQRLLWIFPLLYLVIKGAGAISMDGIFGRRTTD